MDPYECEDKVLPAVPVLLNERAADMQEYQKKAFDFAADLTKQLITLSTSISRSCGTGTANASAWAGTSSESVSTSHSRVDKRWSYAVTHRPSVNRSNDTFGGVCPCAQSTGSPAERESGLIVVRCIPMRALTIISPAAPPLVRSRAPCGSSCHHKML